jgi:hypothetical protein
LCLFFPFSCSCLYSWFGGDGVEKKGREQEVKRHWMLKTGRLTVEKMKEGEEMSFLEA